MSGEQGKCRGFQLETKTLDIYAIGYAIGKPELPLS
jgi:hypothetical protein